MPPQSCRCHRKPAVFGRQPPFSEQQAKRRPPCLCAFVPFCGCLSPTPQCWKRLMRAADRMVYCHPRCEARLCGRPAHTGIPTTNNEDGVDLRMFFHSSPQHDQTPCLPAHTHTEHVGRTAVAAEFENPTLWQNVPPPCPCAIVPVSSGSNVVDVGMVRICTGNPSEPHRPFTSIPLPLAHASFAAPKLQVPTHACSSRPACRRPRRYDSSNRIVTP